MKAVISYLMRLGILKENKCSKPTVTKSTRLTHYVVIALGFTD